MANGKRESFRPQPIDRSNTIDLPTSGFPDSVTVDLDATDPNAFVIDVVDDTPEADRGKPTSVDDLAPVAGDSPSVQKRINRLKAETHTERRAREEAERREAAAIEAARVSAAEVADLRRRLDGSTGALAASMKSDREARLEDAKRRLAQAHAEGDSNAIATATADMGMVQAELVQIASRTPVPRTTPEPEQRQAPQQQQAPQLAPAAAAWIARNSWFNRDPDKTRFAVSLHNALEARGIRPTSPEYTRELDKGMKAVYSDHVAFDDNDGSTAREEPATPRRTNVVADGSRETGRVVDPRKVTLTASQLAIAKQLNITPQQYAASLAKYAPAQRNGA